MFTGIVQAVGTVRGLSEGALTIAYDQASWDDSLLLGESVCVNGCCLTVVDADASSGGTARFDLSPETLQRTSLGSLASGTPINLERALRPTDRFGGHIVQGHVDGVGTVLLVKPQDGSWLFRFEVPEGSDRYMVDKGSIAVDGISLTVDRPAAGAFGSWIIPYTYENTNLKSLREGDAVNLEFDLIAKYVLRMLP